MTSLGLEKTPAFSLTEAEDISLRHYHIVGKISSLPSERDQNFLVKSPSGKFVLKVSNAGENREFLMAQNDAVEAVNRISPITPNWIPTKDRKSCAVELRDRKSFFIRLFEYAEGIPLSNLSHKSPKLLGQLGEFVGKLNSRLANFEHPTLHRELKWDLANGPDVIAANLELLDNVIKRDIQQLWNNIQIRILPLLDQLPKSVVHNDANDGNVIVRRKSDGQFEISAIIDFGDMVHSFSVADLAVAIGYSILNLKNACPLQSACCVVQEFHRQRPLTESELAALFGLVQMRLLMSMCIAAFQTKQRPEDPYLTISQKPIQKLLPWLIKTPFDLAEALFRKACGLSPDTGSLVVENTPSSGGRDEFEASEPQFQTTDKQTILSNRRTLIGASVKLSYEEPLQIVRGLMQYLYDETERRYLDAYNNVPHVGHCHPAVVQAAQKQIANLNTNTRYLHENLANFASRLVSHMPKELNKCFFVNSATEANELAIRLARNFTGNKDMIVLESAYHGNSSTLIDLSPYKHSAPGGCGRPDWVHVAPLPDCYRGIHRKEETAGVEYAREVQKLIHQIGEQGTGLCGFLAETCPSVAGQIMAPQDYFSNVFPMIKDAGGVCIADEVQTGYGRIGTHFFAFEKHDVVPDIVVLGKPIGNGHPIGAVVTTAEIATAFDNGVEFFSTFGGNTVSCAIGDTVLAIVENESLQSHSLRVGCHLKSRLLALQEKHSIIGDVRGSGFFLGIELVRDRTTREPAEREASWITNRMCQSGILIGTDGWHHNVLKIRPPMPFQETNADELTQVLDDILAEL